MIAVETPAEIRCMVRVRRLDGSVEERCVGYWHRNPLRRAAWRLGDLVKSWLRS